LDLICDNDLSGVPYDDLSGVLTREQTHINNLFFQNSLCCNCWSPQHW